MILNDLIANAQNRLAKRRSYSRLVAEIESLSSRDLADMRGDRSEMLHRVYKQVYG